ncbi:MAG: hypothetical protein GXP53_07240 [Deltaproteobacteria bacterium]|nr:hypothetical protein [Deltaproteobacteria bacterium]
MGKKTEKRTKEQPGRPKENRPSPDGGGAEHVRQESFPSQEIKPRNRDNVWGDEKKLDGRSGLRQSAGAC